MDTALEHRIRKLEDRAEICDLVATYFLATDDDDYAALEKCFAENATFVASGFGDVAGREDILELLRSSRAGMGQTVHSIDYPHISFASVDTAKGIVRAHLELGIGDETVFGAVRYLDDYVRESGRWLITRREMKVVHVGSWKDVSTSLSQSLNVRWPGAVPAPSDFPRR